MTPYAELDLVTNFSFLEGGSHPSELVVQAKALGLSAIGVADRNTLAGVVRAHTAAKEQGLRLLIGSRLVFRDGTQLIVYPRDRAAYGRLCRLLSLGKSRITDQPSSSGRPQGEPEDPAVPVNDAAPASSPCAAGSSGLSSASPEDDGVRIPKGETWLTFEEALPFAEDLVAIVPAAE